jgi:surface antigen
MDAAGATKSRISDIEAVEPQRRQPCPYLTLMEDAMISHRLLPLLLIVACVSEPAHAQINPFRGSRGTPLSADDIAALTDATNRLLDRPQLVAGGIETWSNPQSGARGTVTAGDPVQRKGLACRILRYQTTVTGRDTERSTTLTWCNTKDGWKIG